MINSTQNMNTVQCKSTGKVVELKGYVIIVVQTKENKIKLYGKAYIHPFIHNLPNNLHYSYAPKDNH